MYYIWQRADRRQFTPNFSSKEFECTCGICRQQKIAVELVALLQKVREEVNMPIKITSGFRCNRRQAQLRQEGYQTVAGTSTHELGNAVDITCADMEKLKEVVEKHFNNIGVARTFLHVDIRKPKVPGTKRRWTYA